MKIAYFSDVFLPSINGVVSALDHLSRDMVERGHEVAVVFPRPGIRRSLAVSRDGIEYIQLPSLPSVIYPDVRVAAPSAKSLLFLRKFKPDVIHVQTPALVGVDGLLGAKLLKKPVVGTFHGYHMEPEYLQLVHLDKIKGMTRALWRVTVEFYNRCDAVIALSDTIKRDMELHGVTTPLKIIPNGMKLAALKAVSGEELVQVKKRYGLGDQVVVYVGRLSKEKNLKALLDAFSMALQQVDTAQLALVGDGPYREELEAYVRENGLVGSVKFLGALAHADFLASGILEAAAVFATASTSEVQPMSVIEAMAAGLPIVGVRARGMKDLVSDNGFLAEPGDAAALASGIVAFLTDKARWEMASEQSRAAALTHSSETVVAETESLYEQLVRTD